MLNVLHIGQPHCQCLGKSQLAELCNKRKLCCFSCRFLLLGNQSHYTKTKKYVLISHDTHLYTRNYGPINPLQHNERYEKNGIEVWPMRKLNSGWVRLVESMPRIAFVLHEFNPVFSFQKSSNNRNCFFFHQWLLISHQVITLD